MEKFECVDMIISLFFIHGVIDNYLLNQLEPLRYLCLSVYCTATV